MFGDRPGLAVAPFIFRAPPQSFFASHPSNGAVQMSKVRKSKQLSLFKERKTKNDHGGSLAVNKRRSKRPLNLRQSHHITMKSNHAVGPRSLFRYKKMILSLIKKNSKKFQIKVFGYAIQGNHLHLLVKAQTKEGLQNFFRVVAGHMAQRILKEHPLKPRTTGGASLNPKGCLKNQRKFWSFLLYSRIVSWGRDFRNVITYIQKNTLELLNIIAYQSRAVNRKRNSS